MAKRVPTPEHDETTELAEALGEIKAEVKIKGRTRTITPFRAKQFVEALKCVDKLVDEGVVVLKVGGDIEGTIAQLKREFNATKMVLRGGDQVIRIVSIASGLGISEVEGLNMVDMVKLTASCFKVNLDFFDQNADAFMEALWPLREAVQALIGEVTGGGETSPASTTTATESPT